MFSGTTLAHYEACAVPNNGSVLFDKSKHPDYFEPARVYTTTLFSLAGSYAKLYANQYGSNPLVMESDITDLLDKADKTDRGAGQDNYLLHNGVLLPVTRLWLLRSDLPEELSYPKLSDQRVFYPKSPATHLKK